MENINLIVVDGSEEVTSSIKKYFEFHSDINILKTFADGKSAYEYLVDNHNKVDVILMDVILQNLDGISLLDKLKQNDINKKAIIISNYLNDDVAKRASFLGVNYYMLKPFSMESLQERIKDLFKMKDINSNKYGTLEIEISSILHNLGIPSHIRGYRYIRDGIMILYDKNNCINYITKEVYPELAEKYETTSSRIERAIRNAIEISWERGDLNLIEDLFGHSIDYNKSKPTNYEYLSTIVDRVKLNDKVTVR